MFFRKSIASIFIASIISTVISGCATSNQTSASGNDAICVQAIKDLSFKRQLATSDGDYSPYPDATLPKGCKAGS
jgi:hypothetical protein